MEDRLVEDVDGIMVPARVPAAKSRDVYVVEAAPLASLLQEFVTGQTQRRIATSRSHAIDKLVERTQQLDPSHRGVPLRTVENFLRTEGPRYPTTDLRIADALLTAIGRPDAIGRDPGDPLYPHRRTRSLTGTIRP